MDRSKSAKAGMTMDPRTTISCFRLVAIVLAGVIFASLVDVADFAMTLAMFLAISGILRGTAAAIAADEIWAHELNRWDEATLLIIASIFLYCTSV
ncbi:MAG: hypothetical protein R3F54_16655 [Alphaproteobacteria bacterium]